MEMILIVLIQLIKRNELITQYKTEIASFDVTLQTVKNDYQNKISQLQNEIHSMEIEREQLIKARRAAESKCQYSHSIKVTR